MSWPTSQTCNFDRNFKCYLLFCENKCFSGIGQLWMLNWVYIYLSNQFIHACIYFSQLSPHQKNPQTNHKHILTLFCTALHSYLGQNTFWVITESVSWHGTRVHSCELLECHRCELLECKTGSWWLKISWHSCNCRWFNPRSLVNSHNWKLCSCWTVSVGFFISCLKMREIAPCFYTATHLWERKFFTQVLFYKIALKLN